MTQNERHFFPKGQKRKKIIEQSAANISEFKNNFHDADAGLLRKAIGYTLLDSPLDIPDNEEFSNSFRNTFREIIPEGWLLKDFIEGVLEKRKGEAVGVEFGGPGKQVFKDFTPGFFKHSVGVTLIDHVKDRTGAPGHEVLEGDMLALETYQKLNDILEGEQVDLIIERMAKGLNLLPQEPYTVGKVLATWYSMLREGGIMIVQTPVNLNFVLGEWAKKIEAEYPESLQIKFSNTGKFDTEALRSSFWLHKLPGAPKELPLLDPRVLSQIRKGAY